MDFFPIYNVFSIERLFATISTESKSRFSWLTSLMLKKVFKKF